MTPRHPQPAAATRRRVVTTAGHLAWSTPLIVAASAAPAFAASGAAAVVTGQPSFTIPVAHVRVSTVMSNQGTSEPDSMQVVVRITPLQGGLDPRPPAIQGTGFALSIQAFNSSDGSQTLTFTKTGEQIAPRSSATLTFDFYATPSAGGIRQGSVVVSPSVPVPSTATANSANYLATVS